MTQEPSPEPTANAGRGPLDPQLVFQAESNGSTRVNLMIGERTVSWLWIVPFTLQIGSATVRMDGIGGVNTEEDCRHRGYSRRVLEATVARMKQGDGALSMLYGIPHFYPKYGYTTAGPDHFISLTRVTEAPPLPYGWRVRPFAPADMPMVRLLYEQNAAAGVGAAVRSAEAGPWRKLARNDVEDDCRLVEDREGQVRAYAWRARWHWYVQTVQRHEPDALVIGEAMADGAAAADAVLTACRAWAVEESRTRPDPVQRVVLAMPPVGPVAAAAMYQPARSVQQYSPCGSSMARVLDTGRLLAAMKPELVERLSAAGWPFHGALHFVTDSGEATLTVTDDGMVVAGTDHPDSACPGRARPAAAASPGGKVETISIHLPQMALARLALGAFPPEDLLDRLEQPLDDKARRLVATLFPLRHPHMSMPDRY